MAEAEPESFHDAFLAILKELELLKQMQERAAHKSCEPLPNKNNGEERPIMTNLEAEVEVEVASTVAETRPSSAISESSPVLRKRRRKQEKDKILRVDVVKAEEEETLERLKKEECRRFLQSFREVLPNFTPNDAVFKDSASLDHNLDVCKRLAGRVGRFMREKDAELEAENVKAEQLEEELRKEHKLIEELSQEVTELDETLEAVLAVALEGSKTDCPYCSINSVELGERKKQKVSGIALTMPERDDLVSSDSVAISVAKLVKESENPAELALKGNLALNCSEMSAAVLSLKPFRKKLNGLCEEMEFVDLRNSTKSDGSLKVNRWSHSNMLSTASKNSSVFPQCQQPGNETNLYAQKETNVVVEETTELDGKEIDAKLIDVNAEAENECKEAMENRNQEVHPAAECKDYQRIISTVNVTEALNGYSEGTGYDGNYLTKLSELENEFDFIDIKCGCTSLKNVDTIGTLRIYKSGLLKIYCECTTGCNEGKPMSPAAFKIHAGHGAKRKWKDAIWILMDHKRVQLSMTEILEPHCQKYKDIETMKNSQLENTGHISHTDSSILGIEFLKKPRLRLRKREDCNIDPSALGNAKRDDGHFTNAEKDSCFAEGHDLQKQNICYNLRRR